MLVLVLGGALFSQGAADAAQEGLERDIAYATPARCRLDIKWPTGQTNFPTVVWFHGGGLTGGGKHFNVRKFAGDTEPQYLPKIDALAPLNYCSKDLPPIISICGEEPWEWACRSEENRLMIASCVALGHRKALFISCPCADHSRAYTAGVPYVEMFVKGQLPLRR